MKIGKNIKRLRREHDMTQEELAEKLNITVSAVSQWEVEKTMPDISALPLLASIFDVTTDELLGLKGEAAEQRAEEYLKKAREAYVSWRHEDVLAVMEEAYENFPTNMDILDMYSFSLDLNYDKEHPEMARKCIEIGEILLDRSRDEKYRFRAIRRAVKNYARLEDKESARKYAEMLPFMPHDCAPNVLRENRLLPDEEKLRSYQQGVQDHLFLLCQYLFDIADPNYTNPLCKLTIPERVEILEQIITIVKTVYGKDLHAKYYLLYNHTRVIGALWLFGKEHDRALDAFEKAYEYAMLFKTSYKDGDCYTAPALKGVEAQPQSQFHDGADTALKNLYHRFTTQNRYKILEENPRFIALMEKLKQLN